MVCSCGPHVNPSLFSLTHNPTIAICNILSILKKQNKQGKKISSTLETLQCSNACSWRRNKNANTSSPIWI